MRYFPAAAALSLLAAMTASAGLSETRQADPRAVALQEEGRALLAGAEVEAAIDSFEAALVIDPGYSAVFLDLADAARVQGLQGKAISYYRETLRRDPNNLAAISGEGAALAEKGAMERARRNLTQLQELCGAACPETRTLAAALDRGPLPQLMATETISPDNGLAQN